MPALIDLTNQHFGKWTVLYKGPSGQRNLQWFCRCECGITKYVDGCHLRNGKSKSCRACIEWKPRDASGIASRHWQTILDNAQRRGIEVSITRLQAYQVYQQQEGRCALSGLPIALQNNQQRSSGVASLDRIDSRKGYSLDNIQWLHQDINVMKGTMSDEQFIHYCSLITQEQSFV